MNSGRARLPKDLPLWRSAWVFTHRGTWLGRETRRAVAHDRTTARRAYGRNEFWRSGMHPGLRGGLTGLSGASPYQSAHFSRLTSASVSGANPLRNVFSVTTRGKVKLSK
jgi:hypothetical protein